MKLNKIKEMSSPELEKELGELKTERINTILTERKIAEKKGDN